MTPLYIHRGESTKTNVMQGVPAACFGRGRASNVSEASSLYDRKLFYLKQKKKLIFFCLKIYSVVYIFSVSRFVVYIFFFCFMIFLARPYRLFLCFKIYVYIHVYFFFCFFFGLVPRRTYARLLASKLGHQFASSPIAQAARC